MPVPEGDSSAGEHSHQLARRSFLTGVGVATAILASQTLVFGQRAVAATLPDGPVARCIALASSLDEAGERVTFLRDQAISGQCPMPGRVHARVPAIVQSEGATEQVVFAVIIDNAVPDKPLFYGRLNDANMSRFNSLISSSGEAGY